MSDPKPTPLTDAVERTLHLRAPNAMRDHARDLERKLADAVEALDKYAGHAPHCAFRAGWKTCECGLDAAIDKAREGK